MNTAAGIRLSIDMGYLITTSYLSDLSDADLMHRPHAECNHIKWQMGHLIMSEHQMVADAVPGFMPALPEGFAARYTKETASSDDPAAFDSRDELMRVFEEQRAGTLTALATLSDADFDQPSPEHMRSYAPTLGAMFSLQGSHWVMHAGQWAVIRRQLGHPPLF